VPDSHVSVADAARELDVTPRRVVQLVNQGKLNAERVGKRFLLVERASVEHYRQTRRAAGRPARRDR